MTNASALPATRRTFMDLLAGGLALASIMAPTGAFAQASSLSSIKIATIGAGHEGGAPARYSPSLAIR